METFTTEDTRRIWREAQEKLRAGNPLTTEELRIYDAGVSGEDIAACIDDMPNEQELYLERVDAKMNLWDSIGVTFALGLFLLLAGGIVAMLWAGFWALVRRWTGQ